MHSRFLCFPSKLFIILAMKVCLKLSSKLKSVINDLLFCEGHGILISTIWHEKWKFAFCLRGLLFKYYINGFCELCSPTLVCMSEANSTPRCIVQIWNLIEIQNCDWKIQNTFLKSVYLTSYHMINLLIILSIFRQCASKPLYVTLFVR